MSRYQPHSVMTTGPALSQSFRALWVMMIGFILIVVDSTVVSVANPVLKQTFDVEYHSVLWVTTAYLVSFSAFLMIGGRLGDRYGTKHVYVLGLALFTASSAWCAMSNSVGMLIAARVAQGFGAALLTPQVMSTITRTFPPERHGAAMSVWGATTGVGLLAGPILGGILLAGLGWQWIFLINVPIGVAGVALAVRFLPALPVRPLRIDVVGAVLSGAGICLVVLGLQEGQHQGWSTVIWASLAGGVALIAVLFAWQARKQAEPLIPLKLMANRNFVFSSAGIALVSFAFVAFGVPLMIYLQEVSGLSPFHAALLTAPMAVATGALAPFVGKIVDRAHPRPVVVSGFALLGLALVWLVMEMAQGSAVWRLALPLTLVGIAGAFTWEPLSAIATRGLPLDVAGAGSALCNTARHMGAALSSASIAAMMAFLLGDEHAEYGGMQDAAAEHATEGSFADAMSQSILLAVLAAGLGALTGFFLDGRVRADGGLPS